MRTQLDLLRISKEAARYLSDAGKTEDSLPQWDLSAGWPNPKTAAIYRPIVSDAYRATAERLGDDVGLRLAGMLRLKYDAGHDSPWAIVPSAKGDDVWLVFTKPVAAQSN